MRPPSARLAAGAAAVLLLAVGLTGCSGAPAGGCGAQAGTGSAAQSVDVSRDFGTRPTVRFPNPLHVEDTQIATVSSGHGPLIGGAQEVVADVTLLDATTGAAVTSSAYTGDLTAPRFVVDQVGIVGLRSALTCSQAGERLVAVIPPSQGITGTRPASLSATDSLVAVVDVRKAYPSRADGTPQVMAGGLPSVVLAPNGRPGVTLPEGSPPRTLQVADLRVGSGAVVKRGDQVVAQYTGVLWVPGVSGNGKVFDSSWSSGTPTVLPVKDGQIVKGLVTALAGQRVGSQVLAILPPSEAYGSSATAQVPAGSTLVFVVDILGKV